MPENPQPSQQRDSWEKVIQKCAGLDPDRRLNELMKRYPVPGSVRVLDLGCAAGRNTEVLVRQGFDTLAIDISDGAIEATRDRIIPLLGVEDSRRRVFCARMDDLSFADDGAFDLILALGIYQFAQSQNEWLRALDETGRVMRPGGRCLVANAAPGTGLKERPGRVKGTRFVYEWFNSVRTCFLSSEELDLEFQRIDLLPETPSRTVDLRPD